MREVSRRIRDEESLVGVEGDDRDRARGLPSWPATPELEEAERRYLAPARAGRAGDRLAASRGAALGPLTADRPKCMIDVRGHAAPPAPRRHAPGVRRPGRDRGARLPQGGDHGGRHLRRRTTTTTRRPARPRRLACAARAAGGPVRRELRRHPLPPPRARRAAGHRGRHRRRGGRRCRASAPTPIPSGCATGWPAPGPTPATTSTRRSRSGCAGSPTTWRRHEAHGEWMGLAKLDARAGAALARAELEAMRERRRRCAGASLLDLLAAPRGRRRGAASSTPSATGCDVDDASTDLVSAARELLS